MIFAHTEDEGLVVLEAHESAAGPDRYAIWDDGLAHPVTPRAEVLAHPLHRCPSGEERDKL